MKKSNFQISIPILAFILLINSCSETPQNESRVDALPFYKDASFTPYWLKPNSDSTKQFHRISPFQLVNQEGDTVTEKTFEDKIYVTDFFFTICPGICPKMMKNMDILQEEFLEDDEILLLSHSIMPEVDTVATLKEYALSRGIISKKWHLVTGAQEDIYKLGRKDYFVEESLGLEKSEEDFLHTENFVLIDKNRHIRGIYNGLNKTSVQQLIIDIKALKLEG